MTETPSEISFTFEGRKVRARDGQSIAGALHATGVRTLSRSVKYHSPRGYTCGFGACGDCPLSINGMPNTVACTTPVQGGEVVRREQGMPGAKFDLLRAAELLKPWLGAGFQFKLFAKQPRLSKLAGTLLGKLAGGGRMPSAEASARSLVTDVEHTTCEVAVVGGSVSGLTAALAAAEQGASVIVIDRAFAGGRSSVRTEPISSAQPAPSPGDLFRTLHERVQTHPAIRLVTGVAIGWIDGMLPVVNGTQRLEIVPRKVIVATGSYEVPSLFPGHDRPGVMFADAALKLAEVENVRPGSRAVIIQADPRAIDVAERLRSNGVRVVATVDEQSVDRVTGWSRATGVIVKDQSGTPSKIRADLICIAGPRRPADELALHLKYADLGSHDQMKLDSEPLPQFSITVGSAAGSAAYSLDEIHTQVQAFIRASTEHARDTP